jgi:hypothetical protein
MSEPSIPLPPNNPLEQLTLLLSKGATITKISQTPVADNGLPYCYVEVTGTTGTHYVIHAYEKQAILVYEIATKIIETS